MFGLPQALRPDRAGLHELGTRDALSRCAAETAPCLPSGNSRDPAVTPALVPLGAGDPH